MLERLFRRLLGLEGGAVGRARFLAGLSLVFFVSAGLTIAIAVVAYFLRWPSAMWTPILALVLFILLSVSLLSLSAQRLRDIGWNPARGLGGLMILYAFEQFAPPLPWPSPVRALTAHPLTTLASWALGFVLVLWPGRDENGETRGGTLIPATITALLLGAVGVGLVFDPLQGKTCPVYGAGAPSDDCESYGVVGRLYSGLLVVDANKRLDRADPAESARALKGLEKAIAVRPQFVYAYNSLGLAHAQLNDKAKALAAFDRALALQPAYVHGLLNRARLLEELGQRQRALADLRAVLAQDPNDEFAKSGVAYMTGQRP